ncbi:hypothetical protein Gotur_027078, partial [Gossypium turneri]
MIKRGLIVPDLGERYEEMRNYCEFHHKEGHEIQECKEFKVLVQCMMDDKEVEFYEEIKEEGSICASESTMKVSKVNHPVVIILRLKNNDVGVLVASKITIQKPASFSYKDSKKVPWNYECNVTIPGRETSVGALKENQGIGFCTHSERCYDGQEMTEQRNEEAVKPINKPVGEEEAKEFLKFLKHSEYSVVEQL